MSEHSVAAHEAEPATPMSKRCRVLSLRRDTPMKTAMIPVIMEAMSPPRTGARPEVFRFPGDQRASQTSGIAWATGVLTRRLVREPEHEASCSQRKR